MVHMKRGVVESLFVERDEPIAVTNIKKAMLANLNMDISASRRSSIESNRLEILDEQTLDQSPLDQSYFTVREQSLHGDCQTSYTIHPLPAYEAKEIEERLEEEERQRSTVEHLQGGLSQGREVCRGKKYYQLTKTRNFDNCVERPVFQKWSGIKSKCDTTKASCKDLMTHISATNYIICGEISDQFVIRKAETENTIFTSLGWNTEEKFYNSAKVTMALLKEETRPTPFAPLSNPKEVKSLVFEYPEKTFEGHKSLSEELSEQEKTKIEQESGIRPVLPKPDLRSAPKMLVSVNMNKQEVAHQVVQELHKVAQEIFESPESCSSKGDVAGHLAVIAKALRPLSFDDLKYVESQLESQMSSVKSSTQKALKSLFYDVVAMMGTNPAVMLVKERLRESSRYQIDTYTAKKMIQSTFIAVKTPTRELLHELVTLVKDDLKHQAKQDCKIHLYNIGLVHMSNLLYRACINPESRITEFPSRIYGPFCSK
jgi:hypothetical protein